MDFAFAQISHHHYYLVDFAFAQISHYQYMIRSHGHFEITIITKLTFSLPSLYLKKWLLNTATYYTTDTRPFTSQQVSLFGDSLLPSFQ